MASSGLVDVRDQKSYQKLLEKLKSRITIEFYNRHRRGFPQFDRNIFTVLFAISELERECLMSAALYGGDNWFDTPRADHKEDSGLLIDGDVREKWLELLQKVEDVVTFEVYTMIKKLKDHHVSVDGPISLADIRMALLCLAESRFMLCLHENASFSDQVKELKNRLHGASVHRSNEPINMNEDLYRGVDVDLECFLNYYGMNGNQN